MTRHHLLLAAALLLVGCAGAGVNGVTSQPELWRLPDYDHQAACTPERAVRVKISDITTNIARYHRACVTVEGILYSGRLYETFDDLYRQPQRIWSPQRSDADIEVRARDEIQRFPGFHHVRATGIPVECQIYWTEQDVLTAVESATRVVLTGASDDAIVTIDDSCVKGRFERLQVGHVTVDLFTRFERLVEASREPGQGNLVPLRDDNELAQRAFRAAANFLVAVAERDQAALRSSLAYARHWQDDGELSKLIHEMIGSGFAPGEYPGYTPGFVEIARRENPQKIALTTPSKPKPDGQEWYFIREQAFVCICRPKDCTGLWPIDTIDTGFNRKRPYLCLEVWFDSEWAAPVVFATYDEEGLAEPQVSPEP